MWCCFLTGSDKDKSGHPILKVLNSIEYLTFNLKKRQINVWADFLVQNFSDKQACLKGLHRGNIQFELKTNWHKDEYWTPVLKEIAGEYIGLTIRGKDEILLNRAGADPLPVILLKDSGNVKEWSTVRPVDGSYVYFTGWEGPVIEPGICGLFRIKGSIIGETYDRLMEDHESGKIRIMGGEPLEHTIFSDLEKPLNEIDEYMGAYRKFVDEYNDKPAFYHVFLEFSDNRAVKLLEVSEDMRKRKLNKEVKGRCISWFCSDMDFNIFAKANGPILVLSAN